jgi:CubicO group peptidase (beta-lactamase class C family)
VVEVLRGQTWDQVLREGLLSPLGLDSAGTLPEEALLHGAAVGHVVPGGTGTVLVTPRWGLPRSTGPAGLLHSTARDLLAFATMHLDGGTAVDGSRVLSEDGVRAMQEPQVPDLGSLVPRYGLAWLLMSWSGRRVLAHDGATLGQSAFLRVLPEAGLSVALLTNGGASPRDLFDALVTEVFGELAGVSVPVRPEPRGDQVLHPERFLGRYVREGAELTVRPAAHGGLELGVRPTGQLAADQPAVPPWQLAPYDTDVLLTRSKGNESWMPMVFFDLDGQRYVHFGGRVTPRVSTES